LWQEISNTVVHPGTMTIWWLYQAGVVVKSPGGTIVLVDPYLSDAVSRSYGSFRNVPAPLDPAQVDAAAILASHSHEDHLDPDSIQPFFAHPQTRFLGPPLATTKVSGAGVSEHRTHALRRGDCVTVGDIKIRAVFARHIFPAEPVLDAIGFVIDVDGVTLYHSGDTEFDAEIVRDTAGVVASLVPINGTAGNMNVDDAVSLVTQQAPKLAIPYHYGLWADERYGAGATLDPMEFVAKLKSRSPECQAHVFEPATAVRIGPGGIVA
jgi:L-ascorbate 6-phosphate lactonase